MKPSNYFADCTGVDWKKRLQPWSFMVPSDPTVLAVNRFGDVFAIVEGGAVHYLDLELGTFDKIADSQKHFEDLLDNSETIRQWLYAPLIDECLRAKLGLADGCLYCFKQPLVTGGDVHLSNVGTVRATERYEFLADFHNQIRDVKDGEQIIVEVKR